LRLVCLGLTPLTSCSVKSSLACSSTKTPKKFSVTDSARLFRTNRLFA
ncbi:sensory box protein, partial [Vibrio parahaemolyticus V-223/04]